jgi:type I restriction enzyme R subunit
MMGQIGDHERVTQDNVIRLLCDQLGYEYLGNLTAHDNHNVIEHRVEHFLRAYQGVAERDDADQLVGHVLRKLQSVANDGTKDLYERNRDTYNLLRYGVEYKAGPAAQTETFHLIDWKLPERNRFAVAEEVTVRSRHTRGDKKRPDLVLYVNGIALAIIELKRASVSVAEGIRQNLDNQKSELIGHFFSTIQLVMAGNEAEGLRYGTTKTPERHFLTWHEDTHAALDPLSRALLQLCDKRRFLELIHDFIIFDGGIKKLCRHNQYFAVKAAQPLAQRREGGIIWHTQGSGKSLTMVWLARWLRENITTARILVVTDRVELDEQIEGVFTSAGEKFKRADSRADLAKTLTANREPLIGALVHKFGARPNDPNAHHAFAAALIKAAQSAGLRSSDLFIFVDECHRTQSGELHAAMKAALPDATLIGFTGTPLLKADKASARVFGDYIHTYKFDQAVRDEVVLDLRYEARDIEQHLSSPQKADLWFKSKTRTLTPQAVAQLMRRWGRMQHVFSSRERLLRIVADIEFDMTCRPRLSDGSGNAMLVAGSIYEAFRFYKYFNEEGGALQGKCAVVTSYTTEPALKGESTGEGETEERLKHDTYIKMLADWFGVAPEHALSRAGDFEQQARERFIKEPGRLKLLIVVDKLLTGFDAPSATYLYIDKNMRDHGLFQAICRVNRLDEGKDFGYIVDYRDLFKKLESAYADYTTEALDGYEPEDVAGLLEDRLVKGRELLELTLEQLRALCEEVPPPRDREAHMRYFCSTAPDDPRSQELAQTEPLRQALYKLVKKASKAYASIAHDLTEAGYSEAQAAQLSGEVVYFERLREEVRLRSGDALDLKGYEPAMRHLLDTYIRAEDSEVISTLEDKALVELLAERGEQAAEELARALGGDEDAMGETIDNNSRRYIIQKKPLNPRFYEEMSELLESLIAERRAQAKSYREYLAAVIDLTRQMAPAADGDRYPPALRSLALRAVWDNLDNMLDPGARLALALNIDHALRRSAQDGWTTNRVKRLIVTRAIREALREADQDDAQAEALTQILAEHHAHP